jgi:hypothetical protein
MIIEETLIFQDNHVFINFILPFKRTEEEYDRIVQ